MDLFFIDTAQPNPTQPTENKFQTQPNPRRTLLKIHVYLFIIYLITHEVQKK